MCVQGARVRLVCVQGVRVSSPRWFSYVLSPYSSTIYHRASSGNTYISSPLSLPLLNFIRRSMCHTTNIHPFGHGDLTSWTHQGIFLLNSLLTVTGVAPLLNMLSCINIMGSFSDRTFPFPSPPPFSIRGVSYPTLTF